ncbi:MAG: aspartate 1-decarboxylase [Candidatus Omnitrophica bacterium]|nr:aspartate 1-decarboxylase [Candidatus Omnitrophota bacterium]
MLRFVCKSKIAGAIITKIDLHYGGSIGIDKKILDAANMAPNEVVQVLNQNNGARFETYIIEEKEDSGVIALYGPAARLGEVGDKLYILTQGIVEGKELPNHKIKVVNLDKKNDIM